MPHLDLRRATAKGSHRLCWYPDGRRPSLEDILKLNGARKESKQVWLVIQ